MLPQDHGANEGQSEGLSSGLPASKDRPFTVLLNCFPQTQTAGDFYLETVSQQHQSVPCNSQSIRCILIHPFCSHSKKAHPMQVNESGIIKYHLIVLSAK